MGKRRTSVNFNKHILTKTTTDKVFTIYDFKKPDTIMNRVQFINSCGILAVTGDFGNWIFCREFHPAADNYVSDDYWRQKLEIASEQKSQAFSSKQTDIDLQEQITMLLEDDENHPLIKYYKDCLDYTDEGEFYYTNYAYENLPSEYDYDSMVIGKQTHQWLNMIFDAFDEICKRLKEQEAMKPLPEMKLVQNI